MTSRKINKIIEALGKHEDGNAVSVLEEIGTNSPLDEIRELTAQALVKRNTDDSLKVVIVNKGKGINDLSAQVAMTAINELLNLKDKDAATKILEDTVENNDDKEVRDTARSVRALMAYSS